jgi:protein O-GlcNAc transferase
MMYEQGKLLAAISMYHKALTIEPSFPEAYNNLGNALREAGRYDEAIACYSACIQLQYSKAVQQAQMQQGPIQPEIAAVLAAAGHQGGLAALPGLPGLPAPGSNGTIVTAAGGVSSGGVMSGLAAVVASRPPALLLPPAVAQRVSVAYNNLGGILKMMGQALAAIACYEQVVLLQPDSPEGHTNLASAYKDAARHDVAIQSYRRALTLRQDFPEAFANYVHSLQCVCDWADRPALFVRLEQEVRRDLGAGRLPSVQPFHAMAYPFSAELALAISMRYAEHCSLAASRLGLPALPHPPALPLAPGQRLRVGYVSSDFGNHPLSHLMGSVFGLHDRSKVRAPSLVVLLRWLSSVMYPCRLEQIVVRMAYCRGVLSSAVVLGFLLHRCQSLFIITR